MNARDLYPPIEAHANGLLKVGGNHEIYWEVSGNPEGKPVVFLHGGPGAGASPEQRRFFDPKAYKIVVFDQRGCGRSRPFGEWRNNGWRDLVADMELLREELGLETWQLFGGSWGSTLALGYAVSHPDRVSEMILRGIFLGRAQEIEWFMSGMGIFFPEEWEAFMAALPEEERSAPLSNYCRRLLDPDPEVNGPVALAWATYEAACSTLRPSPETVTLFGQAKRALSLARMEAIYFQEAESRMPQDLLENCDPIAEIESVIVQGRYDVICPPTSAMALHRRLPKSQLIMVPDAGHSAMESGIRRALVTATDAFRNA